MQNQTVEEKKEYLKKNSLAIPKHIGIIMDGNRRYAKHKLMVPWKGHEDGARTVEYVLGWCVEFGVKELTLYTFSIENFKRPKDEFKYIMKLFKKVFDKVITEHDDVLSIHKNKIRVSFIGRIDMFDKDIQDMMRKMMDITKDYDKLRVNFAMAYGGRYEIIDAIKKIAKDVKDGKISFDEIDEKIVGKNLYRDSDVDLLIRTSGEQRISNFLPWQLSYAEFYFEPHLWPEFTKEDFVNAVYDYAHRHRRFGGN